jgi:hypothetical protein
MMQTGRVWVSAASFNGTVFDEATAVSIALDRVERLARRQG